MTNELKALADHMRILAGPDGNKEAWLEMQAYLLHGADAIDGLLAERDAAIYEAAVLLGEAVRRPLWGSLQGDWVDRANAWNRKWGVAAVVSGTAKEPG